MEQNKEPRNKTTHKQSTNIGQVAKNTQQGKDILSNVAGKIGCSHL